MAISIPTAVSDALAAGAAIIRSGVIFDFPSGTWAFWDGDGDLTLWPIGLPKEAYGFSRDARGRFGPPSFDAAAFDLPAAGSRQAIRLH